MSKKDAEINSKDMEGTEENIIEASPKTKLERRRRIEDLFEEKRMREELGEFDLV